MHTKTVEQRLNDLLHAKPGVIGLFDRFNQSSVRWAIYAGCETALLTGNRTPTDIDIIVHDDDFETVASLLPEAQRYDDQPEDVTTGDGEVVGFVASGVTCQIDGVEIDIMAKANFDVAGAQYPIRLTDLATKSRLQYSVANVDIFLAQPFDTILIKAFMRRGPEQNKFDLPDAQAICKVFVTDKSYKQQRLKEVGQPKQVADFLQKLDV